MGDAKRKAQNPETWVMVIVANEASGEIFPPDMMLQSIDYDKGAPGYPTGDLVVTYDPNKAATFSSFAAVLDAWKRQSLMVPYRPDGQPNRPLTVFTVTPKRIKP